MDNPYWERVKDHIDPTGSLWGTPTVDSYRSYRDARGNIDFDRWEREGLNRRELVKRYSWTIPSPETVAFVAEHSGGRMVDPMAGTGYWGWLLMQAGIDVVSYDIAPGTNAYHDGEALHCDVITLDGIEAAALHAERTLLLSWPPMTSDGAAIVRAYRGDRVIYIGEGESGCTGDDELHELLAKQWREVADHTPIQWDGIHDRITVHERTEAGRG